MTPTALVGRDPAPALTSDPATALIVRTLAAGAWLEARPGGRLWCSDPGRLLPALRRDLAKHRADVWELVRAGEVVGEMPATDALPKRDP